METTTLGKTGLQITRLGASLAEIGSLNTARSVGMQVAGEELYRRFDKLNPHG